jgi:hypothetical protein
VLHCLESRIIMTEITVNLDFRLLLGDALCVSRRFDSVFSKSYRVHFPFVSQVLASCIALISTGAVTVAPVLLLDARCKIV